MEDPGIGAIDEIRRRVLSSPEWSVEEDRGFVWWPALHGQRIWAEPPFQDDDLSVSRVHASVDIAHGIEDHLAVWEWLATLGPIAVMSCVEIEEETGTLRLQSTMEIHREIAQWATPLLRFAALTQLRDAAGLSVVYLGALMDGTLPAGAGSLPDHGHPRLGTRTKDPDPAYFATDRDVPGEPGNHALPWIPSELDELVDEVNRAFGGVTMAERGETVVRSRVVYDLDADDASSFGEVVFITGKEHPTRGRGVFVHLNLPVSPDAELLGVLNRLEASGASGTHVLGSWFANRLTDQICFGSFISNRIMRRGLLFNLLACDAMRARWVRSVLR